MTNPPDRTHSGDSGATGPRDLPSDGFAAPGSTRVPPAGQFPGTGGAEPADPHQGPSSDWHSRPPEDLSRMIQPGVVPLRPLMLGDVFSGAMRTIRRNPGATIGMSLLVAIVLMLPSTLAAVATARLEQDDVDAEVLVSLVAMAFTMLASIATTGMIVYVVSEAVLGVKASLGQTWAAVRRRIPALAGTVLLVGVIYATVVIASVLLAVAVIATTESLGLFLLLMVALAAAMIYLGPRLSLATAPVVLEKVGPVRGVARAWSLTRGRQGWRVIGITLLAGLVAGIVSTAIQLSIGLAIGLAIAGSGGDFSTLAPSIVVTDQILGLLVSALITPFTAGVTALLYLDQRIRREGLDTALVRAAQARASQRG